MTSPSYIPAAALHDMSHAHLTEALAEFCAAEGLPDIAAMDLLHEPLAEHQREWLRRFVDAWEQAE